MVGVANLITAKHRLRRWDLGFYETAPAPSPGNGFSRFILVLAEKRTNRPDILRGFRRYRGGWDIASRHYWAVLLVSSLLLCGLFPMGWHFLLYFVVGGSPTLKAMALNGGEQFISFSSVSSFLLQCNIL